MPSHAKRVQQYGDDVPLFHRFSVENKLDAMHSPVVQLRSGGYIVINPTEALVAIDINSGRSTKERNIEETALKTNVEAAEEIARQLRLRDLAGLIVIDFIDMDEHRNERTVERKLKDALKGDRARIQVGRISSFGLLELSRQRLRPSLHEALSDVCPHCTGSGYIRSIESTALHVLRGIEQEGMQQRAAVVRVLMPTEVALYLLNDKRASLIEIEGRYDMTVLVERDDGLIPPDHKIETVVPRTDGKAIEVPAQAAETAAPADDASDTEENDGEDGGRRRKRRRKPRRRRGSESDKDTGGAVASGDAESSESDSKKPATAKSDQDEEDEGDGRKRRRRGKRGGRRRRGRGDAAAAETTTADSTDAAPQESEVEGDGANASDKSAAEAGDAAPKRRRRRSPKKSKDGETAEVSASDQEAGSTDKAEAAAEPATEKPAKAPKSEAAETASPPAAATDNDDAPAKPSSSSGNGSGRTSSSKSADSGSETPVRQSPPRRGWWQKITG